MTERFTEELLREVWNEAMRKQAEPYVLEERAAIVAWLHEQWVSDATDNIDVFDMIDGIKAGEHLK